MPNIHGGGNRTNLNGLQFEQDTLIEESLIDAGFVVDVEKKEFKFEEELKGKFSRKTSFYKDILEMEDVNECYDIISKQLRPDEVLYVIDNNTVFIIEKKFQNGAGSVDEKLQTCDFKKKQYQKLINNYNQKNNDEIKVEYIYVLGGKYFNDPQIQDKMKDVFQYIIKSGCRYYFNNIPLKDLFC